MVILGLGSNIGDRLDNLRKALHLIRNISKLNIQQISPVYISDALLPENAPESWNVPYLNAALRCETTLAPIELLNVLKNIEKKVGRIPELDWGPRIIDIDILAWDNLIQYDEKLHIPHEHLHERPFALWPLTDVAPFWVYPLPNIFQGKTAAEIATRWSSPNQAAVPFNVKPIAQRIDTSQLVGILNITPDSFSDGGKFFNPTDALQQFHALVQAGAEIIDIGAEATGPNAVSLGSAGEWQRLAPLLTQIYAEQVNMSIFPKISIDTRYPDTAKNALELGVNWINDVSGCDNVLLREVLADHSCDIVFMHHLGIPVNQSHIALNQDSPIEVLHWAKNRILELERCSIDRSRLIFDVGIGYGKTAEQSLALIKKIEVFRDLGVRLLVGHSRKSFLTQFTRYSADQRDIETTVISLDLSNKGIEYLRVHNVEEHARAFRVHQAISNKSIPYELSKAPLQQPYEKSQK